MSTVRPTWAEIDLDAFARNVDAIASRLPERSRLIAVLKANAYGHGAVELAHRLSRDRVAMIAVSLLEEALELGRAGITLPLLVLGPLNADQIALACEHDITIAITGPEVLDAIRRVDRDVVAHLKLDTGMGRMGVVETELAGVIDAIRATPRLRIDAIYTHLANASDPDDPFTDEQLARFRTYVETLREAGFTAPLHHVANSAATVRGLVEAGDYVRVGIALYGGAPLDGPPERPPDVGRPYVGQALSLSFEPVMRWRTAIARLKDLPPGHAIGYGTTFHTRRASRIATLPIGYADGYNRLLSNRGEVLVRGQRAPVVGRVSMDLVTIDVTDIANAAIGDEVVLLGDGISAEEIASKVGTISYEVFCNVSARVPRVYLTHNRAS
ncbi:MAG TPA: alanine racemase [Thermoanaerobaculia bacterium]|nr:alanine racemase [Thermoanaerobaculia bacterium]